MIQEILRSSCELYFVLFFFPPFIESGVLCECMQLGTFFFASYRGVDREPRVLIENLCDPGTGFRVNNDFFTYSFLCRHMLVANNQWLLAQ